MDIVWPVLIVISGGLVVWALTWMISEFSEGGEGEEAENIPD